VGLHGTLKAAILPSYGAVYSAIPSKAKMLLMEFLQWIKTSA